MINRDENPLLIGFTLFFLLKLFNQEVSDLSQYV